MVDLFYTLAFRILKIQRARDQDRHLLEAVVCEGNFAPNQRLSYHLTICWILALGKGLQFLMFSEICLCYVKNYVIMRNVGRKACKSASHTLFSHLLPTPANEELHVNLCKVYIWLIIKYKMTAAEPSPLASSVEKTNGLSSKWDLNYCALTLAKQSFGSLSADILKAHELNFSFWACQKSKRKKWTATTWQPLGHFDTIPFFTAVEEVFWGLWSRENVFACCCQHAVFVVKLRARLRTELFLCEYGLPSTHIRCKRWPRTQLF